MRVFKNCHIYSGCSHKDNVLNTDSFIDIFENRTVINIHGADAVREVVGSIPPRT